MTFEKPGLLQEDNGSEDEQRPQKQDKNLETISSEPRHRRNSWSPASASFPHGTLSSRQKRSTTPSPESAGFPEATQDDKTQEPNTLTIPVPEPNQPATTSASESGNGASTTSQDTNTSTRRVKRQELALIASSDDVDLSNRAQSTTFFDESPEVVRAEKPPKRKRVEPLPPSAGQPLPKRSPVHVSELREEDKALGGLRPSVAYLIQMNQTNISGGSGEDAQPSVFRTSQNNTDTFIGAESVDASEPGFRPVVRSELVAEDKAADGIRPKVKYLIKNEEARLMDNRKALGAKAGPAEPPPDFMLRERMEPEPSMPMSPSEANFIRKPPVYERALEEDEKAFDGVRSSVKALANEKQEQEYCNYRKAEVEAYRRGLVGNWEDLDKRKWASWRNEQYDPDKSVGH